MNTIEEHLSRHSCADLFLDTFNYNAHSTAIDSLWAELPVVTMMGRSFASRVGASLLSALGLEELIAKNTREYEKIIIDLGNNETRLIGTLISFIVFFGLLPDWIKFRWGKDNRKNKSKKG